jgi:hypothetical protein
LTGERIGYYLRADDTNLYFTTLTGRLMRVPLSGGPSIELGTPGARAPIVTDGQFVYWSDASQGTLTRVPVAGGPPEVLASGQLNIDLPEVDDLNLYWYAGPGDTTKNLMKMAKSGGAPSVLLQDVPATPLRVSDGYLVLYTSATEIIRLSRDGGEPKHLRVQNEGRLMGIASGSLYNVESGDDASAAIQSIPLDFSSGPRVMFESVYTVYSAVSSRFAYGWSNSERALVRHGLTPNAAEELVAREAEIIGTWTMNNDVVYATARDGVTIVYFRH